MSEKKKDSKDRVCEEYKLKSGEQWEKDALLHYPHFCPNCGHHLNSVQPYWEDSSRPETIDNPFKGMGYDCYCRTCHWSGSIIPDADREVVDNINDRISRPFRCL